MNKFGSHNPAPIFFGFINSCMLRFKEFLVEDVVKQIELSQKRANLLGKDIAATGKSTGYSIGGIDTYAFTKPKTDTTLGDYTFFPKGEKLSSGKINSDDWHKINIYTDTPAQITNPSSKENSTVRHELQHLYQKSRQLQDNPNYAANAKNSTKYNQLRATEGSNALVADYVKQNIGKDLSYTLDPQEVNARGIQKAGDAIEQHNRLSRSVIANNPAYTKFSDYEFNLEKSKGMLTAPKLNPNIGRKEAEHAFRTQMGKENKSLDDLSSMLQYVKQGDAAKAAKDIKVAKKSISSDIARGLQSNVDYAQSVAADAYSDKVVGPQRERATRVANTQAEVEGIKAKYGGFQTSPFLSDPLSVANMAADMAGALGDVNTKAQTMTKAAASRNNPMFSDSEQMMGDAFLRGGGEEYQVDPKLLQIDKQREKDKESKDKLFKKYGYGNMTGSMQDVEKAKSMKDSKTQGQKQTLQRPE